jgi:predicted transcriptional regulator
MKKILISIRPEYVEQILDGTKKFEYRTKAAKSDIKSLIIYSTFPTKKIVAEVMIDDVLCYSPNELWNLTKLQSGISKEGFFKYFANREKAYAYKLGEVKVYKDAMTLNDFGIKYAPQSFIYVNC